MEIFGAIFVFKVEWCTIAVRVPVITSQVPQPTCFWTFMAVGEPDYWITSIIICFVLGGFLCFPTEPFFRAIQPLVYSSAFQLCSDHSQVLLFVSMPHILFSISLFSIAIGLNRDGSRKGDNDHHPCFFCTIIQPSANNLHIKNTHMRMCIKSTFAYKWI